MTFVVHLDGMREIHDYVCDYPGLWDIAVDAIKTARARGFRVTTNTTIFKETEVDDVIEMMRYLTDDVGIDGMLVAPGYQYSQIDPELTMTRAEHEVKFRAIRTAVRKHGYRWLATPIYQDFLTGERKLVCAVGIDHAQPVRLERPLLSAHGRDLPNVRGAARRDGVGLVRPWQRSTVRALRHPLRLRAIVGVRVVESLKETVRSMAWTLKGDLRVRPRPRSASRASRPDRRADRRPRRGRPARGPLVSFGLAGALRTACMSATCSTRHASSTSRRDALGGAPLGVPGARAATCSAPTCSCTTRPSAAAARVERCGRRGHGERRARASGRLAGVVRAISDVPASAVEGVATVHPEGRRTSSAWSAGSPRSAVTRFVRCATH